MNTYVVYSLEATGQGAFNEYLQHMFSWRNKNNIMINPLIWSHEKYLKMNMFSTTRLLIDDRSILQNRFPTLLGFTEQYSIVPFVLAGTFRITQSKINDPNPASILYKSIAGRNRPVRVADGPITARYRFIKNAYWELTIDYKLH